MIIPKWKVLKTFLITTPTLLVIIAIFYHVDRGIDITDEGFYLVSAIHSNANYIAITNFSHYTGFLLSLVGNDVPAFRSVGIIGLLLAASFLIHSIKRYSHYRIKLPVPTRVALLWYVTANTSVLVYYFWWLPTPSYNWLALLCCLFTLAVILRLATDSVRASSLKEKGIWVNTALLGLSLMITFMAKPTSMVALGAIVCCWATLTSPRHMWWQINLQILFFWMLFFILHIVLFEPSLSDFIIHLKNSIEYANILSNSVNPIKVIIDAYDTLAKFPAYMIDIVGPALWLVCLIGFINGIALFWFPLPAQYLYQINITLVASTALFTWWLLWETQHWEGGTFIGSGLISYGALVFLSMIFLATLMTKISVLRHRSIEFASKHYIVLIFSGLFCALAYGIGSTNGILRQSSGAYVFYGVSTILVASWLEKDCKVKVVSHLVTCLIFSSSFLILNGAYQVPYRVGTSLSAQTIPVTFLGNPSTLQVNQANADYINTLKELAETNGWQENTPFIDMTGATPLAAFILNGVPLEKAWIIGGYSGSEAAATWLFKRIDKDVIKHAWVLTTPEGHRQIPLSVLEASNIIFEEQFEIVGELYSPLRSEIQLLWRPKHSNTR